VNKLMIIAALCAAFGAAAPAARAATTPALFPALTDVQIYCGWAPYAAKCAPAARPVAAKPKVKTVAMVKPAAKARPAPVGVKVMACKPAARGAGHLYDCVWQTR
jgi:hypothetical protein